jgi:hypothetical protein
MNKLRAIFSLIILSQISLDAPQKEDEEFSSILRQIEIRDRADIEEKNRISNSPQQPNESNQCAFFSFANALESIRSRNEHRRFDKNFSESLAHFIRDLALRVNREYKANPNSLFEVAEISKLLINTGNSSIEQEFKNSNISLMSRSEMPSFNELCTWAPQPGVIIFADELRHHFICLDIDPSRSGNEIIVRDSMELLTDRSNSSTQHYTDLINEIKQRFNILQVRRHSPGRPMAGLQIRPSSPTDRNQSTPTRQALPVSLSDNKERILSPGRRIVSIKQQQDEELTRRRQQQEQDAALARRLAQKEADLARERSNKQAKENRDLIECRMCTFENPLTNLSCEMCESVLIN